MEIEKDQIDQKDGKDQTDQNNQIDQNEMYEEILMRNVNQYVELYTDKHDAISNAINGFKKFTIELQKKDIKYDIKSGYVFDFCDEIAQKLNFLNIDLRDIMITNIKKSTYYRKTLK